MSDNIPFDIQREIIEKVSDVKSLVRFTSVSKLWKSCIESSKFIKSYGARHTQPHSHILILPSVSEDRRFICLVEDDNIENIKVQKQDLAPFVLSPLHEQYDVSDVVGVSHGLVCLHGCHKGYNKPMFVIWNPSIGKSFGIVNPYFSRTPRAIYGFGVCPVTKDPTIVIIINEYDMPWHVEVFTLTTGVWNVIPRGNVPRKSIQLDPQTKVVIDRFIYWGAEEEIAYDHGAYSIYMVVSFDLIKKEFKVVDLPDYLTDELSDDPVFVSKLRESLVVYGSFISDRACCCGVWKMESDSSFTKLFSFVTASYVDKVLGFSKNGEPIYEIKNVGESITLDVYVYDPCSLQMKNLGIFGKDDGSSFMGSYKESLLLLDHSDSHVYISTITETIFEGTDDYVSWC